jgi:hypothetical protein
LKQTLCLDAKPERSTKKYPHPLHQESTKLKSMEKQMNIKRFATLLAGLTALMMTLAADACTGIRLIAEDGSVVDGRTGEFGSPLEDRDLEVCRETSRLPLGSSERPCTRSPCFR